MTPKQNYKLLKELYEKFGEKNNEVNNGLYSIYKNRSGQFEVTFLNKLHDEYFYDPHILVAVNGEKAFAFYYWNNFANTNVTIKRSTETKKELDERLHVLLERFDMCINN